MILTSETRARLCDLLREYEATYAVPIRVEQLQLTRRSFPQGSVESERVLLEAEITVARPGIESQRRPLSLNFDEDARNLLSEGVQEADLRTAALIIFANIDEWWRCKDHESDVAAMGRRLS
ncbi:hypothetical protein CW362_41745 [Streptomyces populi]|uniref:Uncharacterized protein n=1 Tax=Streptomyces populi TaxID=2058924 RepID=A0A2I0SB89_9ACTN|nr:hypothetical protein [Streptomyces populi]PKT67207.1 hypothetical protein CW362_41745 [Streptomyces populi]